MNEKHCGLDLYKYHSLTLKKQYVKYCK